MVSQEPTAKLLLRLVVFSCVGKGPALTGLSSMLPHRLLATAEFRKQAGAHFLLIEKKQENCSCGHAEGLSLR